MKSYVKTILFVLYFGAAFTMDLSTGVVIKKKENQIAAQSPFCGNLTLVSTPADSPKMDMALFYDIKKTKGHFHQNFEEVYLVVDGWLELEFYEPHTERKTEVRLEADEMVMIRPGVHHRIVNSSEKNRLYVMCLPGFNHADEIASDILVD